MRVVVVAAAAVVAVAVEKMSALSTSKNLARERLRVGFKK